MPTDKSFKNQPTPYLDPTKERDSVVGAGSLENDSFVINDVGLQIPPEQITVHKQSFNHEWQTLRTRTSQKSKSGYSIARVSLDIIFNFTQEPQVTNDRLRRLVAGLRATPFCSVYNAYLEGKLLSTDDGSEAAEQVRAYQRYKKLRPVALALASMSFSTCGHEGEPACIRAHLEFLWFNYFPYCPIFAYKAGENFDHAGYAWESPLWKSFYEPFMRKSASIDWPRDEQSNDITETVMSYKEFKMVPKGSEESNAAVADLLNILKRKPKFVTNAAQDLFAGDENTAGVDRSANASNILDKLYAKLNRSGLTNPEIARAINQQNPKSLTNTGGGLVVPILSALGKHQGSIQDKANQMKARIEGTAALFTKRAEKLRQLKQFSQNTRERIEGDFKEIKTIEAKMPVGKGASQSIGGLTLLGRIRNLRLQQQAGFVIEQINVTFTNILATIPMVGYRYPTIQHVGSMDADITFVINCHNTAADVLSAEYDRIETMALKFKQVPQSARNVTVHNDFLKLFGVEDFITKDLLVQTIPGQPGRSRATLTMTETGIPSTSKLNDPDSNENPEQIRQEFVRSSASEQQAIWKILDGHLHPEGIEQTGSIKNLGISQRANIKTYKQRIIGVTQGRDLELFKLTERARDIYNRVLEEVHKATVGEGGDEGRKNAAALASLDEVDKDFGFLPGIEDLKSSVAFRSFARSRKTGSKTGDIYGFSAKSQSIIKNNISRSTIRGRLFPNVNAQQEIEKNIATESDRRRRIGEMGITVYAREMHGLFTEIAEFHSGNPAFKSIAEARKNSGLGKGVSAYPDFREQLRSVVQFSTGNNSFSDALLLNFDPDTYFWYPLYDGASFSAANINNLVDPETIAYAKIISTNVFEQAQGSMDSFFTRTYSQLLRTGDWQGPWELMKNSAEGQASKVSDPLYSGQSWNNSLRDPDTIQYLKGISKSVWPDAQSKVQTNRPLPQNLESPGVCTVNTDITSLWDGVESSANNPLPVNQPKTTTSTRSPSYRPASTSGSAGTNARGGRKVTVRDKAIAKRLLPIVTAAGRKYNIDPAVLLGIIKKESNFVNIQTPNRASACGYMQVTFNNFGQCQSGAVTFTKDSKGKRIRSNVNFSRCKRDLRDTRTNIFTGAQIFARSLRAFNNNVALALSGYNAGNAGIRLWLRAERKNFQKMTPAEARQVRRLGKTFVEYQGVKVPLYQWNRYHNTILPAIDEFKKMLSSDGSSHNNAARYVPPKVVKRESKSADKSATRRITARSVARDVSTTVSSPLRLAIDEFTNDVVRGQGQSMMRAYPTFKLYFVEDDSNERKRLAFDDFFSYNAVQSIRVVRSRKIAADLCEIYLTNVSGVLSNRKFRQDPDGGTKPRNRKGEITEESRKPMEADTAKENPIASLLLQEGVHIHLRLGYSSDPDRLETVFNGVITGIQFSESEDLVRIIAQSYAVELVSDIKGVQKPRDETSFGLFGWDFWGFTNNAATSRILEEMLAEPEVLHFGRWIPGGGGTTPNRELLTNRWRWFPTPQDDNIFAPPPAKDLDTLGNGFIVNKLRYIIYRTTIWDIFKEMELRHPNFIASPVPYQDRTGQRMTMFFGLPNQLYFARHPTPEEQSKQNKLVRVQEETEKKILQRVADKNLGTGPNGSISKLAGVLGKFSGIPPALMKTIARRAGFEIAKRSAAGDAVKKASTRIFNDARLNDAKAAGYIKPFRNYHLLTSSQHIISNNIRANSQDVANHIVIKYGEEVEISEDATGSDLSGVSIKGEEEEFSLKLDNALPTEDIRTLMGQYINVNNESLAKRYALALLTQQLKEAYKGEICILGNPKIKPYDVCYLFDEYTDMVGPIEVEEVQHIFDQQHGFRTEIKPDMLVQAAEWSLLSSAEALGVVMEGALRKIFGRNSTLHNTNGGFSNATSDRSFSPYPWMIAAGISMFGGFMSNKIINYTQLAQPVIMSPLLHHGRVFAGGLPTRKINTSFWNTIMGNWSPAADAGFPDWNEDWKDEVVNSIKKTFGVFSQGNFGQHNTEVI